MLLYKKLWLRPMFLMRTGLFYIEKQVIKGLIEHIDIANKVFPKKSEYLHKNY